MSNAVRAWHSNKRPKIQDQFHLFNKVIRVKGIVEDKLIARITIDV